MASTIEVFLAGLALLINTVVVFTMIFINFVFWGPFLSAIERVNAMVGGGPLSIGEFTYLFPFIFAVTFIMWIVCIIAFIVVIGRRTVYDDMQ